MKVEMLGYRDWAAELYTRVRNREAYPARYVTKFEDLSPDADLYFLIGWSEMVPEEWYRDRLVLVLHPSPLPRYRGGSPIQHQIIAGETESAVTLFKLDVEHPDVDSGPIVSSHPYSLEGDLDDVLQRISVVGSWLVGETIRRLKGGTLTWTPQDESQATTFKRRRPRESELPIGASGLAVHNQVRALQDPYPNAFIDFEDGRLFITKTRWEPK